MFFVDPALPVGRARPRARSTPGCACSRSRSRCCSRPPGFPKVFPNASPRRVAQLGFLALFAGLVVFVGALEEGAGPEIVTVPLLLAGLGIGALASQLGCRDRLRGSRRADRAGRGHSEHDDEPRCVDRYRARRRRAHRRPHELVLHRASQGNPAVPADLTSKAQTELTSGVPFISDADLESALDDAGVPPKTATAIVDENATRTVGRLAIVARVAGGAGARRALLQPAPPHATSVGAGGRSVRVRLRRRKMK